MINLIDRIPKDELKMIDNYRLNDKEVKKARERYGDSGLAPIEYILKEWNFQKQKLYTLLGNQLIFTKDICIEKDKTIMEAQMKEMVNQSAFKENILNLSRVNKEHCLMEVASTYPWESVFSVLDWLFYPNELIENKITGRSDSPAKITFKESGHNIQISNGTKPLRALKKIAEECHVDGFEEFRLMHSRILNDKKLKGQLCLSIHPLDYMTMSDNNCAWTSCMSWREHIGAYRAGTVEMMNSPVVVEAYLKSTTDMEMPEGGTWSNKKWRELFIINEECILGIKGYPYWSKALEDICMNLLRELAEKNLGWTYKDAIEFCAPDSDGVEICTNTMYNDVYDNHSLMLKTTDLINDLYINYSGDKRCMYSGEYYEWDEEEEENNGSLIVCPQYTPYIKCECCDIYVFYDEAYDVNAHNFCRGCYDTFNKDLFMQESLLPEDENKTYHQYMIKYDNNYSYSYIVYVKDEDVEENKFVKNIEDIKTITIECRWWTDEYLTINYEELTSQAQKLFIKKIESNIGDMGLLKENDTYDRKFYVQDLTVPYHLFVSHY